MSMTPQMTFALSQREPIAYSQRATDRARSSDASSVSMGHRDRLRDRHMVKTYPLLPLHIAFCGGVKKKPWYLLTLHNDVHNPRNVDHI